MTERGTRALEDADYERLLRFRDGLRRFLHWSAEQARAVGVTPSHHQLMLAIRGHGSPPSIGDVAQHLLLRHHSVVEMVSRAVEVGLVARCADGDDQRIVRLRLTELGEARLDALAEAHLEELSRQGPQLTALWDRLPSAM